MARRSTRKRSCPRGQRKDRRIPANRNPSGCRKSRKSTGRKTKRKSTGRKTGKSRKSTGKRRKRCQAGSMKDRRIAKNRNPSGCRVNPRSTHWLGKEYARLPHTGSGVASAVRLPKAVMPSSVMVVPAARPAASAPVEIAPPAIVAPPAGDAGRPADAAVNLRDQQVQGAEKRPDTIYSATVPTWPFDRWQYDRTNRDEPEHLWATPDPRLAWMEENEGFGFTKRDRVRHASDHLRRTNLNPYGYLKANRLPFISDKLTVDFRPYTPHQENDSPAERRTAYLTEAFADFKQVTGIEDRIASGNFEKGMLEAWADAVVKSVDIIAHDDTPLYSNYLPQVYAAFPDQVGEDGPFYNEYYEHNRMTPFDVFAVHAVACMLSHPQYDNDELYNPVDLPADSVGLPNDVAGDPMESYNEASIGLAYADSIVKRLMAKKDGVYWYPDIVDTLMGGTYENGDDAAAIMLEFYMSLGTDFRTPSDV